MQKIIYSIVLFMVLSYLPLQAQPYGKLYKKAEADNLYGPVLESISIPTTQLRGLITKAPEVILFKIINKKLVVLGKNRTFLYSSGLASYTEMDVFHMYSSSLVQELIDTGGSDTTVVEKREKVMSITNGASTLEFASSCPPDCPK